MPSDCESSKLLVFLPETAGTTIIARLSERGFTSALISTVPQAFDALRSDKFAFAITTRPDINLLRNIRPLPVINLEVFFHAGISGDGSSVKSKWFDNKAFIERVEFLARASTKVGSKAEKGRAKAPQMVERRSFKWWTRAANTLGL
ncbi:hypothetical protein [Agrobacterium larrymoorei]|uniref:Uncharacterized protein n=1 Tax=Agrobacterium larrymoorei TaxID=160699 RepID=A0A4D7E6L4_9HYPH|nr:hypothetical protein [Agrobacterium larrymoorei]QCJ01071.1 hypothetical protein CFBP5473_24285 [Agrobacterium larrymoorei]QYA10088.1 hypothetical protein J5285_22940 [Agrobacterium larrymoorei]